MTKAEKLTQYYRWQFLRLNKGYQRESDLYVKGVVAISKNKKLSESKRQEYITQLEGKLYMKYGINGIYNYRIKNPPPTLRIYGDADFVVQKGTLKDIFTGKLESYQEISGNHLLETIYRNKKEGMKDIALVAPKYVQLVINYDAELCDIKREISKIIKPTHKIRREELGIKQPTKHNETFCNDYDKYLKVWELHSKGLPNKKVAKIVFPNEGKYPAEDKAPKYRQRAFALINGGYRAITF